MGFKEWFFGEKPSPVPPPSPASSLEEFMATFKPNGSERAYSARGHKDGKIATVITHNVIWAAHSFAVRIRSSAYKLANEQALEQPDISYDVVAVEAAAFAQYYVMHDYLTSIVAT